MTLPTSGTISFSELAFEYTGSTSSPISLSSYYGESAQQGPIGTDNPRVPTSGPLAFSDFYGLSGWLVAVYVVGGGGTGGRCPPNEFSNVSIPAYAGGGSGSQVVPYYMYTGLGDTWTIRAGVGGFVSATNPSLKYGSEGSSSRASCSNSFINPGAPNGVIGVGGLRGGCESCSFQDSDGGGGAGNNGNGSSTCNARATDSFYANLGTGGNSAPPSGSQGAGGGGAGAGNTNGTTGNSSTNGIGGAGATIPSVNSDGSGLLCGMGGSGGQCGVDFDNITTGGGRGSFTNSSGLIRNGGDGTGYGSGGGGASRATNNTAQNAEAGGGGPGLVCFQYDERFPALDPATFTNYWADTNRWQYANVNGVRTYTFFAENGIPGVFELTGTIGI